MLGRIAVAAAVAAATLTFAAASVVHAGTDPDQAVPPTTQAPPPSTMPLAPGTLIPIPAACPVPEPAAVAFVGTMVGKDDVTQTVRFEIEQLRAGSASRWAVDGLIDVRFGPDYRFLDQGERYLVGAGIDPTYGALASRVREPEPVFGGNDVVGINDVAVDCPRIDDPVRTLNVDGTSVDSGVLSLLTDDKRLLAATVGVPAAITFAVLAGLVLVRMFGGLAVRGFLQLGRAAVTPVPDQRAVRVRRHRDAAPPTSASAMTAADDQGVTATAARTSASAPDQSSTVI